jgi:molybdopterin-guanine dinucleotide biosynthesis protein B
LKTPTPKRLSICGFKKSGKTTLIEKLLKELSSRGCRLGVIKRQNEPVQTDQPGADTFRFYQAGAAVLGWDGQSIFFKRHQEPPFSVNQALDILGNDFDLILIEGFKNSNLEKIWLLRKGEIAPPPEVTNIIAVLKWPDNRLEQVLAILHDKLNLFNP